MKLTGDLDGVDTNALVDMVGNLSLAIHQINDEIQSNKSLRVTIKHIRPGCYDIFLSIKETMIDNLLRHIVNNPTTAACEIMGIVAGIMTIKKCLKGEAPQKVEHGEHETLIINGDGNQIFVKPNVYKIFSENKIVAAAIGKSFDALSEDPAIDGFELYDQENRKLFSAPRDEFQAISAPDTLPENETRIKQEEAILTIFKVVFEKGYKWQFYYQGNKISASIEDETFFDAIDRGAKFSKGDTLIVDLNITQVFDKAVQTYITREYRIIKIKQRMPRSEQAELLK